MQEESRRAVLCSDGKRRTGLTRADAARELLFEVEVLLSLSKQSLEDLELQALNRSANLQKQFRDDVEYLASQMALAIVANWLRAAHDRLRNLPARPQPPVQHSLPFPEESTGARPASAVSSAPKSRKLKGVA